MANYGSNNQEALARLQSGKGSPQDIRNISNWFLQSNPKIEQQQELLDTFFASSGITPGSEKAAALGLTDKNNDGKITSADITQEDFAEVFTGAIMSEYGIDPDQAIAGATEYTPAQIDTYNAITEIKGGNINGLQSLPGVHSFQIDEEKNRAVLFIGDSRDEKKVLVLDMEEGRLTDNSIDILERKFKYTDINPKGDAASDGGGSGLGTTHQVVTDPETGQRGIAPVAPAEQGGASVLGEGQTVTTAADISINEQIGKKDPIVISNANLPSVPNVRKRVLNDAINALAAKGISVTRGNLEEVKAVINEVASPSERLRIMNAIKDLLDKQ